MSEQYMVGIISNCQAGYIEAFLAYYGLEDYVDFTRAFGDFHKQKAENIQDIIRENKIKEAIYIGDIENDYLSAKKRMCLFIGEIWVWPISLRPLCGIGQRDSRLCRIVF